MVLFSIVGLTDCDCMQDAVTYAQEKSSNKRDTDGQTFYDYEIFGPVRQLMCIMPSAILNQSCNSLAELIATQAWIGGMLDMSQHEP